MKTWLIMAIAMLMCFISGALLTRSCSSKPANDTRIDQLEIKLRSKEAENVTLRNLVHSIRTEEQILKTKSDKAEARALTAEAKYNQFRWTKPKDKDQQIEFLKRDTALCDTALIAAKAVARAKGEELKKSQEENEALDSLTLNLTDQKEILTKTVDAHVDKEKELTKKNKWKFWKGAAFGAIALEAGRVLIHLLLLL